MPKPVTCACGAEELAEYRSGGYESNALRDGSVHSYGECRQMTILRRSESPPSESTPTAPPLPEDARADAAGNVRAALADWAQPLPGWKSPAIKRAILAEREALVQICERRSEELRQDWCDADGNISNTRRGELDYITARIRARSATTGGTP